MFREIRSMNVLWTIDTLYLNGEYKMKSSLMYIYKLISNKFRLMAFEYNIISVWKPQNTVKTKSTINNLI